MAEKVLARMRTINQCLEEIKALDNDSCISKWCIYQLAKQGKVKSFTTGRKIYINQDDLIRFFTEERGEKHLEG